MIVGNKYEIIRKINRGSFGLLYEAKNIRTNELVALKVEKKNNEDNINTLRHEAKAYWYLKNVDGFLTLKWFGSDDKYNYLVINLLGKSLKNVMPTMFQNNYADVSKVGKKIIGKIMALHENCMIHRDIKPDNILLNVENDVDGDIYLIDFSFLKKYSNADKKHNPQKKINKLIGTSNYVSLNIHNLIEPSRRDDLESLVYTLMYLYHGKLEWQITMNLSVLVDLKEKSINDMNILDNFKQMLRYVRSLEYDERPNYFYLIDLL